MACPCNIGTHHPSSNGLAERAVQTVKHGITKTAGDTVRTKLNRFLFQYRLTPHTTTGKSPAELLNHRRMRSLLDLIHPTLQGKVQKKQMEMKLRHDGNVAVRKFNPGDAVRVKNFAHGAKWLSGIIQRITGPLSYEVQLLDGRSVRRHVDHIIARQTEVKSWAEMVPSKTLVATQPSSCQEEPTSSYNPDDIQLSTSGDQPPQDLLVPELHSTMELSSTPSVCDSDQPSSEGNQSVQVRRSDRQSRLPAYLQDYECT